VFNKNGAAKKIIFFLFPIIDRGCERLMNNAEACGK